MASILARECPHVEIHRLRNRAEHSQILISLWGCDRIGDRFWGYLSLEDLSTFFETPLEKTGTFCPPRPFPTSEPNPPDWVEGAVRAHELAAEDEARARGVWV